MQPGQRDANKRNKPGRATIRRATGFAALCIIALAFISAEASAKQTTGKTDRLSISSDAEFAALAPKYRLHTLIRLIQSGRHELAARLLTRYPFTGPRAANRTLFLSGMIAKARGDLDGAVKNYRAALASDPNLSLVRMELAHTLSLQEKDTGAKHHLELLRSSAPTVETSRQFDRFIDTIDAQRPWAFDAYVSLAPSTNFTNGTNARFIRLNGLRFRPSAASREKSGIGLRGGANASYTLRAGKDLDFIIGAGLNATEYEGSAYDDFIVSQSVMLRKKHARGSLTGGFVLTERWLGYGEFYWSLSQQASIYQRLAPKVSSYTKLRHTIYTYDKTDYRSGQSFSIEERLGRAFSQGTIGYLIASGERALTKRDYLDYWAASAGLGLYYEAPLGLTFYSEAEVERKLYDSDYPGLTKSRKDTKVNVSVSLHKRDFDIMGVTPQLHYSYIRNFSNSPIDRYETHGANITLTKKF